MPNQKLLILDRDGVINVESAEFVKTAYRKPVMTLWLSLINLDLAADFLVRIR